MSRFIKTLSLTMLALILCQPSVWGGKIDRLPEESSKPNVRQIKFNVVPFLTVAKTTGKASEYLEYLSDNFADKILYGGGVGFYYHPHPGYAVGLNVEYLVKDIPETDLDAARGFQYSGSFILFLRELHKAMPYLRAEFGVVTAKVPNYPQDGENMDLGSHPVIRLGFGLFAFTSSHTNTRIELYYKTAFSSGHRIEDFYSYKIDFNAECIGVELGVGIPL